MKIKANKNFSGVYFFKSRILKFNNTELIDDEDLFHLFMGVIKLMKQSIKFSVENKYLQKIKTLENKLKNQDKII